MKKAKEAAQKGATEEDAGDELVKEFEHQKFTAATEALALRWIRMARDSLGAKFREKSLKIRDNLATTLGDMPEEDDWYYGAGLRLEGSSLLARGQALDEDRRTLEAEASVKINKINLDLEVYVQDRESELHRERDAFELQLAQKADRIALDIEIRHAELQRLREAKAIEFAAEEKKQKMELGAASTELTQSHRNQLLDIENLMVTERERAEGQRDFDQAEARVMFDRAEKIKLNDLTNRKIFAGTNSARIRETVAKKVHASELEWQQMSGKWLTIAQKKVEIKKKEDAEARKGKRNRKG